ncbi:hypothetical protein C4569_01185 [Candidatus Parcubacteria bacterium]|nr:MAG: hypothetical protein C4569_01185 [Candidatus Parcubacteria bacterium]
MDYVGIGIGLAFAAMLCWGFGDFLIQRSTRAIGEWEALFVVGLVGTIVLSPFILAKLSQMAAKIGMTGILVIITACIVLFLAAILDFTALRVGKLAVIEPIWSIEIPVAAVFAFFILKEQLTFMQTAFILLLMLGLFLVSIRGNLGVKEFFLEKGVVIALLAGIIMGGANFFIGWGARLSDPLLINFVTDIFLVVVTGTYLFIKGRLRGLPRVIYSNRNLLLPMGVIDKIAWVAFAFAMALAPISIAVALSESYIVVAVILGLAVNREKLNNHQKFGLVLATFSAITLAVMTVN